MSSVVYQPSQWGTEYHSLTLDEALGAGSAGPGKTTVLVHEPDFQIVVESLRMQRKSADELIGGMGFPEKLAHLMAANPLERGGSKGFALFVRRELGHSDQVWDILKKNLKRIDPGAQQNEQRKTITYSSGYRYKLGHCANSGDWDQYLGDEFTIIMFDELVAFDQEQYDQICTRLRTSDPVLRELLKIRAMSNPYYKREGNTAQVKDPHWVRRRFVDDAPEGRRVLYEEYKHPQTGEKIRKSRIYLPAKLTDNPDKGFQEVYLRQLIDKPAHIRQALIEGDWYIVAGAFFSDDFITRLHKVSQFKIPSDWKRFRSMDWGFKKPGCVHWYAMDPDGNLVVEREMTFRLKNAQQVAEDIREIERSMGLWDGRRSLLSGPADTQLWEERGDTGETKAESMAKVGVTWVPANKKSRQANAGHVMKRLTDHENGSRIPGLRIFDCCEKLLQTLPTIPPDPDNPEEPLKTDDGHWYESLSYACSYASRGNAGISMRRPRGRDDDDDSPAPRGSRGRHGYGEAY